MQEHREQEKTAQTTPKVSIITAVYNNERYISQALESVLSQTYSNIEYIVIDGGSTDGTLECIEPYRSRLSVFISEPDQGIYDALNKGIAHASGEIVGILHSDDLFQDEYVVSDVIEKMQKEGSELCFSDMVIVDRQLDTVFRYYKASYFRPWLFRIGWMPPHPTTFFKKDLFKEFGLYTTRYKVVGDFDFFVRLFFSRRIAYSYINRVMVRMRVGGLSNMGADSKRTIRHEITMSLRKNRVWSPAFLQWFRYVIRVWEMVNKPGVKALGGVKK